MSENYLSFSEPGFFVRLVELDDDGGELVDDSRIWTGDLEQAGCQVVVDRDVGRDAVLQNTWQLWLNSSCAETAEIKFKSKLEF